MGDFNAMFGNGLLHVIERQGVGGRNCNVKGLEYLCNTNRTVIVPCMNIRSAGILFRSSKGISSSLQGEDIKKNGTFQLSTSNDSEIYKGVTD